MRVCVISVILMICIISFYVQQILWKYIQIGAFVLGIPLNSSLLWMYTLYELLAHLVCRSVYWVFWYDICCPVIAAISGNYSNDSWVLLKATIRKYQTSNDCCSSRVLPRCISLTPIVWPFYLNRIKQWNIYIYDFFFLVYLT